MSQAVIKGKKRSLKPELARRVEAAGPAGERLRQLVKKHPVPQQWYDEEGASGEKRSG
jgi:hypothetical protein